MAILIDPPAWPAHGTLWSHLVSDESYEELHAFARRLGFSRRSFDLDHYDVSAANFDRAVELGALPVSGKEVVFRLRQSGLRVRQADRGSVTPQRRRQYLVDEWARLGETLGVAAPGGDWQRLGADLIARWNEPQRSYHDERHLEDVLLALDHLDMRGEHVSPVTQLAAWFHDAVYEGAAGADERASADLAVSALTDLGIDAHVADRVRCCIIATIPGGQVAGAAIESAAHGAEVDQLLDADLWIFASLSERYAEYASSVRAEYASVPDREFAAGRARILASYLDRPAMYRTTAARDLWEPRARINVERELKQLREVSSHLLA